MTDPERAVIPDDWVEAARIAFQDRGLEDHRSTDERMHAALSAALPLMAGRGAVAVRPLEWRGSVAECPFGDYSVERDFDDSISGCPWCCWSVDESLGHFATLPEAKAAAQADYAARILSALAPDAGKAEASALERAARRHMLAVKRLGEDSGFNRLSFFEAPVSRMPNDDLGMEAVRRWKELNDAGKALTEALDTTEADDAGEAEGSAAVAGVPELAKRLRSALSRAEYIPGDSPVLPFKTARFMAEVRAELDALPLPPANGEGR